MLHENRLCFIQIPYKRLKKDRSTQENNSTFIFIADKAFGFPVGYTTFTGDYGVCKGLQGIILVYKGLQGIKVVYKGLQGYTSDNRGIQGITAVDKG